MSPAVTLQSDTLRGDLIGENILFLLVFKFKCNFNLPFPVVRMPRRTALPRPLSDPSVSTSGRTGVRTSWGRFGSCWLAWVTQEMNILAASGLYHFGGNQTCYWIVYSSRYWKQTPIATLVSTITMSIQSARFLINWGENQSLTRRKHPLGSNLSVCAENEGNIFTDYLSVYRVWRKPLALL